MQAASVQNHWWLDNASDEQKIRYQATQDSYLDSIAQTKAEKEAAKQMPRQLVKWYPASLNITLIKFNEIKPHIDAALCDIPRSIQRRLIEIYVKQYSSKTAIDAPRSARIGLDNATKPIQKILSNLPFDNKKALIRDHVLESEAKFCADKCHQLAVQLSDSGEEYEDKIKYCALELAAFVVSKSIKAPFDMDKNCKIEVLESAILRMVDDEWWMRKLKRIRDQVNEYMFIAAGSIKKKHQEYCSNVCVGEWRQQQRANWDYLKSMDIVNDETKEVFNLGDIAEKTTANPDLRRIELFVRVRGLEELAADLDYKAMFITWTAPSQYHKNSRKWNGARPDETQKYLCEQWAKCRASIDRNDLSWFGVRVAEPHADATPHWHMLVWYPAREAESIKETFRTYALEHDAQEKGAQKTRITFEDIDPAKGSATGYIAKYIAKNINAKNVETEPDFDGSGSLQDAADRVVAWASRWRVRQFQFFGAAKVSVWRECRRIKTPLDNPAMEAVRSAADAGKWQAFTNMIAENPISLVYESEEKNKYNEPVKKIVGLACDGLEKLTRLVKWRVCKSGEADKASESGVTWSTVNNCTGLYESITRMCKNLKIDVSLVGLLVRGSPVIDSGRLFRVVGEKVTQVYQ
jgi:hypothetical protein